MTTIYKKTAKCSVCGAENEYTGIGSTNEFGSPDLDTRPPEMKRSTIFAWVKRFPDCGYCASDVSASLSGSSSLVSSDEYLTQLNDPTYPELANSFLCHALLARESGGLVAAALATMHAAWVCDDSEHPDQARSCRKQAAALFKTAEDKGQSISEQEGVTAAIRVDLLRRAGETEEARGVITSKIAKAHENVISRILDFQSTLLDQNDLGRHTIEEAMGKSR